MAKEFGRQGCRRNGTASGIGLASSEAKLAAGARVVMVDRDEAALKTLCNKHGNAVLDLPGLCGERFRFYAARRSN
jgi:ribitol 2-dehydrogenase